MSWGHWIGLAWVLTFVAFIMKQNVDLVRMATHGIFRVVVCGLRLSAQGVRSILRGTWRDGITVWRAAVFFMCEIALIMAKRIPCCRTRLRKAALKLRPYTAASLTTGSPEGATRGALADDVRTPSRRSLLQVRADLAAEASVETKREFLVGARRMRTTRLKAARHASWRTIYNPQGGHGSCLFAALAHIMGGQTKPAALRRMLRSQSMALLHSEKKLYKALSLRQLLCRNGISPQWFVDTLHRRWGNSIDLIVAANMMEKNIQLVDIRSAKPILTVWAGKSGDRLHQVGHGRCHFVVGATRDKEAPNSWFAQLWQQMTGYMRFGAGCVQNTRLKVKEGAGQQMGAPSMSSGRGAAEGVTWSMSAGSWGHRKAGTVQSNENKIFMSNVYKVMSGNEYRQGQDSSDSGDEKMGKEQSNEYKDLSGNVRIMSNGYKCLLGNEHSQGRNSNGSGEKKMGKEQSNEYTDLSGNVCIKSNVYKVLLGTERSQGQDSSGNGEKKMGKVQSNEYKDQSGNVCIQKQDNVYKVLSRNEYCQGQGSGRSGEEKMGKVQSNEYKHLSGSACSQGRNSVNEPKGKYVTGGAKSDKRLDDAIPKAMPKSKQRRSEAEAMAVSDAQGSSPPAKKLRRYPFAKIGDSEQGTSGTARSSHQVAGVNEDDPPPQLMLVYHGSFCPLHPGHVATYQSAARFLTKRGMQIVKIIIGFTTVKQVRRKVGETNMESDELRASIAKKVLQDLAVKNEKVVVDARAASSGTELAMRYTDSVPNNTRVLYIVGSDVAKRPGPETIVVQRTEEDAAGAKPFFDIWKWRVMCVQEEHRGISSTAVRERLAQRLVPGFYGPLAAAELKKVVEGKQVANEVRPRTTQRPVETVDLIDAVTDLPAPLDDNVAVAQVEREEPELIEVGEMDPRLREPGTLRLRRPIHVNLSAFWYHCVEPLAALMRVTPMGVTRRAGDQSVRVPYLPATPPYRPLTIFTDVDQNNELRMSLAELGANTMSFQYLAFSVRGMETKDKDPCSQHGAEFREGVCRVIQNADRVFELASIRVAAILMDASHLVLLVTRLYFVRAVNLAMDIAELLNACANKEAAKPDSALKDHGLCFVPDAAKCDEYRSGGGGSRIVVSSVQLEMKIVQTKADGRDGNKVQDVKIAQSMGTSSWTTMSTSSKHYNESKFQVDNVQVPTRNVTAHMKGQANPWDVAPHCAMWRQGGAKKRARSNSPSPPPPPLVDDLQDGHMSSDCVRVCSFSPQLSDTDPVAACVCWVIEQELSKSVCTQHVRVIAALWISMAAKQHYNIAGTPIVQLASDCGLTKRAYCEQVWDSGASNSPPALFVWVLACVYNLSMAVIDNHGVRLDGTPCRSKWTLVNQQGVWKARGVDDGSHDVELSPTLPFITSDSGDEEVEDIARIRYGGANGRAMETPSRKRQREEISLEGQPIKWPAWNITRMETEGENEVSVHLPNGEIVVAQVHAQDKDEAENLLARHLALDRSWLSFYWGHRSIEVTWSSAAPCWNVSTVNALREVVQGFQAGWSIAFRRRALEKVKTYSFGLRATRKAGISKITREQADFVLIVNHMAQALLPFATYNAFAIVAHANVKRHVDSMNHPDSFIHMLSWTQGQVWVQTSTGVKQRVRGESGEEDAVRGNEHALNRGVLTIPASSAHEITVEGPSKAKTLV
eukprot:3736793-Amphidinium_carterae.1